MSSEIYTNAYLLTENTQTGGYETTQQIAGSATISSSTNELLFGSPITFTDPYNTVTLLYDGVVTDHGNPVGFAAVDPMTGATYLFTDTAIPADTTLVVDVGDPTFLCFVGGTHIATPAGERAVEALQAGDQVLTDDGRTMAVSWVGQQFIRPGAETSAAVMPVRIKAGALGENLPVRDLLVSPDHGLMLDGALVHASTLVNGTTIVTEAAAEPFTYYHVELDEHALLLAEGVAAESYTDRASRVAFDNAASYQAEFGAARGVAHMDMPRAKALRQVPYSLRMRLAA